MNVIHDTGSTMTTAERLRASIHGEPVDHLAFCPNLAYVWENSFPEEIQRLGHHGFYDLIGCDHLHRFAPCPVRSSVAGLETREFELPDGRAQELITPVGTLRQAWRYSPNGNTSFLVEHPLKNEDDYKIQRWIEERRVFEANPQAIADWRAGPAGKGLSIGMLIPYGSKTAYQRLVEHMVGTEELIYALEDFSETVESLLAIMVERDLECVRLIAEQEAFEHYLTWEDSSTQNYSPGQYERYIATEIDQWVRILAASGKYYIQHACGHVKDLVARMAAGGVTAIESVSPAPTGNVTIRQVRELGGPAFGIIGGLEPTRLLNLEGAALEADIHDTIEQARGGGFVLANSDSCPPGVTIEKFALAAEIACGIRWY
jgi:hypothetical protein